MINRRSFLQQSLAVVSLGIGVPSVFSKAVAAAAEEKASASVAGKTLIVVQMAGGVDGLNTVIPYTDAAYHAGRSALAVPEADMLIVDDRIAFHPSLAALKSEYDAGNLAVIEGVGYPQPNLSHFKSMDIWQSADPANSAGEGWLGRYFEGFADAEGHPLVGLSVDRSLPSAFAAEGASVPTVLDVESFRLQSARGAPNPDPRLTSLRKLYDLYRPASTPFAALLDTTLDGAYDASIELAAAHTAYEPAIPYPESSLASGLRLLAELIDAGGSDGSPLRVGHVRIGGFDTHTDQTARLDELLLTTSGAIAAFWQDIVSHGHGEDVVVMTWSEFGRRVRENGQAGTDHGTAGPMFLLGSSVKGGFRGEPPSLTDLDDGNLRFTTDFRSVYATILERWLEAPADAILGQRFDQLDLFV